MNVLSEGYGVAPTLIMRCNELTDGAKLLYIQVNSFCAARGFCWVSNNALSELGFGTESTIQRNIKQLIKMGFITVTLIKSQGGTTRHIFIASDPANLGGADQSKMVGADPANLGGAYKKKNNKKKNNILKDSKESVDKSTDLVPSSKVFDSKPLISALKEKVGCTDFSESKIKQGQQAYNLFRLKEKLGEAEFDKRLNSILSDQFHRSNSGSLYYLYRTIKGFVEGAQKRSGANNYTDDEDRSYLD